MLKLVYTIITLSLLFSTVSSLAAVNDEYERCANLLTERLNELQDRQVLIPPNTPTVVKTQLTLVRLKDIEDEEQKLTTTLLLTMEWEDDRILTEDEKCNRQGSKYVLEATKFLPWYPHWHILNSASTVLFDEGWRFTPSTIYANGTILWTQEYQIATICILDLSIFPFDTQFCPIALASPHYKEEILEYEVEHAELGIQLDSDKAAQSPVWQLVGYSYEYTTETPGVIFKLQLQRKPSFFICVIFMPTIIVNMMTAATFILTPVFEEKSQCAQSCILSYILLMLTFYEFVPMSSNSQPFLVIFFTLHNFLGLACFFGTSMIFRLQHEIELKEEEKHNHADAHEEHGHDHDDEEEGKKSFFTDPNSINDFAFIGYVAITCATYVATFIFIMLGAMQADAKSVATGYMTPKVVAL